MDKFSSEIFTLSKVKHNKFVIPTYQRPYVWGDEQINKLLDDFINSFKIKENQYFIGTVLTSVQNNIEEVIDGQQRFTTLLLIAAAFKAENINSKIIGFLETPEGDLRLDFAIRAKLKQYIELLVKDINLAERKFTSEDISNDAFLINVSKAISTIRSKLHNLIQEIGNDEVVEFGDYIYEKIKFVKNTAPLNTDLNKLFSTINNSGIQLEQTDILKSVLLKRIKTDKVIYSRIWEACENMNNYFERNIRGLFPETDWSTITFDDLEFFNKERFIYSKSDLNFPEQKVLLSISIADILKADNYGKAEPLQDDIIYNGEQDNDEVVYCNSILSFSQLLLHTFRIYLKIRDQDDFKLPFHSKNLLQIFRQLDDSGEGIEQRELNIKAFFECLWQVRFLFDKEVIKWVEIPGEKEKVLLLTNISKSNKGDYYYFSRSNKEKNPLSMLQSVLYFTSNYNTQIWLSAYLYRLIGNHKTDPIEILESIDNQLSLSRLQDKDATFRLMTENVLDDKIDLIMYLRLQLGTSFKHYWFQKLEYILWKNWEERTFDKFTKYRITSKNSVEHIFPQNHEFGQIIDRTLLNSFGNLALLSVNQNSSYSNQDVEKKKVDFSYKPVYDSLKLAKFFNKINNNWSETLITEHQDEMIDLISKHYQILP